jgi:TonB family protein
MLTLELAVKSTIVLALACVAARLLARKSAAFRHLIWSLAFAGLLLLPILPSALPAICVPMGELLMEQDPTIRAEVRARPGESRGQPAFHAPVSPRLDWPWILTLVWAGGAVLCSVQMLAGWLAVGRLRRQATVFGPPLGGVRLLQTAAGSMPMAYGLFRPVIFLPAEAAQWPAERMRVVLSHELAHVRRCDWGTHVMARAALSLYWWNPLAWFAWSEFLKEQELAADDQVLNQGAAGSDYAGHLLAVARSLSLPAATPVVAMAQTPALERRLAAILDVRRDRGLPRKVSVLAACMTAIALITPLGAVHAGQGSLQKTSGSEMTNIYFQRGLTEMVAKNYQLAMNDFEVAKTQGEGLRSKALLLEAVAQEKLTNPESAGNLFAEAVASGEPNSLDTAAAMDIYARFLDTQNQPDQAKSMREKAEEIRRNQPPVHVTSRAAFRAGGDVKPPSLMTKVEPEYSLEARAAGYSGVVRLSAIIGADGHTHDIHIVHALGLGLDQKAVDAVSQWTFAPGVKDGQNVDVRATIEVSFRLL